MSCWTSEDLQFSVPGNGELAARLVLPAKSKWLLVLGRGARAGMHHPFANFRGELI